MKLGVLISLNNDDMDKKFKGVRELGFDYCQLLCSNPDFMTDENAESVIRASECYGVKISTYWCGWSGRQVWDFYEGPTTIGIVPRATREIRTSELKRGSDFAKRLGVDKMATHLGFIPECPTDPEFMPIVETVRDIAAHCKANGQSFIFETGQETPITLKRLIEEVGADNLGVNFDTANLILYGKANTVDAVDILGKYIKDMHAKDGCYPTNPRELGNETRLGDGAVNFPALIAKLKAMGYDAHVTIEREISGEKQIEDIKYAKQYLEGLIC